MILIIPDVHGRLFWKKAVETGDYEKVVFLGDYVDPYELEGITDEEALGNFEAIIAYKRQNPDKVVLLLGNHDLHYYSDIYRDMAQGSRYSSETAITLERLFQDNKPLFQLVWETDLGDRHYLFSHAGVTQSWLRRNLKTVKVPDAQHLNHLPETRAGLKALAQVGEMRWGRFPTGSIVWADSDELLDSDPLPNTYQIVGHTLQLDGPIINDKFACLDCMAAFSLDQQGDIKPVTEMPAVCDIFFF